jgi:hypothetical protein
MRAVADEMMAVDDVQSGLQQQKAIKKTANTRKKPRHQRQTTKNNRLSRSEIIDNYIDFRRQTRVILVKLAHERSDARTRGKLNRLRQK